jgi:phosphate-selective porin
MHGEPIPRLVLSVLLTTLAVSGSRHAAAQSDAPAAPNEPKQPVVLSYDDHPAIELWGAVRLEIKARFDADFRSLENLPDEDAFEWSGRRLGVRGTVVERVEFEVSRELGDSRRPWRDAYLNVSLQRWLEVRGGRFKVPFGEERLRSITQQEFINRSRVSTIVAPGRDEGFMVHGRLRDQIAAWEVGFFDGRSEQWAGRPLDADSDARLGAGRVVLRPFGSAPRGALLRSWRFGAAATRGRRTSGLWEVEGQTIGRTATFTLPVFVNGDERRVGLESTWSPGRFRLGAEWMRIDAERRGQGLDSSDLPALRAGGWYATAMWRVLGRASSAAPGPGWRQALEIGGRFESFDLDRDERFTALTVDEDLPLPAHRLLTLGVNWVGRRWIRVQGNVIWERVSGGAPAREDQDRRLGALLRLQFTL